MTPAEEAAYALIWDLPRDSLDPAVQPEYDRLKRERDTRPRIQGAASHTTGPEPPDPPPFPWWLTQCHASLAFDVPPWLLAAGLTVWASFFIWMSYGVNIASNQMNFRTLRSDVSKVHLPAGYEMVSSAASGRDCAVRRCMLEEFWVWHAVGAHNAADACQDVRRAMETGLPDVEAEIRSYIPRGAACDYYTVLGSFFHPGLGKRFAEALVWVNEKAHGNPGGFKVELFAAYNYWGG